MAIPGQIIEGKYEILKQIGQGGMSKVYLAMDQRLNKQWAVKEVDRRSRDKNNEVVIQSLMTEANLMKKLDHPSLPRIVDIIDNRDTIYIVMDYIEGEPLSRTLKEEGVQSQEKVIVWAEQLCKVLDYLHTRTPAIIYRDMKPSNVMLKPDGSIKLFDFGIAREYKEQSQTDTVIIATRGYAAPEQLNGKTQTDARTDIYCLGVTLYHLLTGQLPTESPYKLYPIRYWNPSLSGGLENILIKCTEPDPQDRYQSCVELLYDLEHYEEQDDEYRRKLKKKLRIFTVTSGLCVAALIAGIGGQVLKNVALNNNYDSLLVQAQTEVDTEKKSELLVQAIDVKPTSIEAYVELLNTYKSEASFSVEEEAQLKKSLNGNVEELRQETRYAELAFEIGKLYWYYYDYGRETSADNQITRMKSSIKWFQEAIEYGGADFENKEMAEVYMNIGKFNQEITLSVEEASDKGKYKPYWEELVRMMELMEDNQDEAEIVPLELYSLVTNSIETYSRKFKLDGVSKKDMADQIDQVEISTNVIQPTADKTEHLKQGILERITGARESIENAFTVQNIEAKEE